MVRVRVGSLARQRTRAPGTEPSAHGSDGTREQQTQYLADGAGSVQAGGRGARYLWAVLLARIAPAR